MTRERLGGKKDWPKLKAKAAACRYLSRYSLALAERLGDETEHGSRRIAVNRLLVRFYDMIEAEEGTWPLRRRLSCPS